MLTLTKSYSFSASYSSGTKVVSHNYRLAAVFEAAAEIRADELDHKIQEALIQRVHSRDLGRDVDFLRGAALSEISILKAFWPRVAESAVPAKLLSLSLESGADTRWTLTEGR